MSKFFHSFVLFGLALLLLMMGSVAFAQDGRTTRSGFEPTISNNNARYTNRMPLNIVVDTLTDSLDNNVGDGTCADADGNCSLRAAIMEANANPGSTITLPEDTITLSFTGGGEDEAQSGDLDILADMTINGVSPTGTILDVNDLDTGFHIMGAITVTITNMTVTNATNQSPAGPEGEEITSGGAIAATSGANLALTNVILSASNADFGGALSVEGGASVTVANSTIRDNTANTSGGAIDGFGIGSLALENVTISGNAAPTGGGILTEVGDGPLTTSLNNVTVAFNTATAAGGGLRNVGATFNLSNSLIVNNTAGSAPNAGPDCSGIFTSTGDNMVSDSGGCTLDTGDLVVADPRIQALALVEPGTTPTHALRPSSAAVNAATNATCTVTDQRGVARPQDTTCDIGAFELRTVDILAPGIFDLLTPADSTSFTATADLTAFTWEPSEDADTFDLVVTRSSDSTEIINETLNAVDICTLSVCEFALDAAAQSLFTDGGYQWTVSATNATGTTTATNAPFTLTLDTTLQELVVNGGFEDIDENKNPMDWVEKNVGRKDKVKTNKVKPDGTIKTFAYEGERAYRFKGEPGENGKVQQKVDTSNLGIGDTLLMSVWVEGKNMVNGGKVKVIVKYVDHPNTPKGKIKVNIPTGTYDYQELTGSVEIVAEVNKVKVQLRYRNPTAAAGKFHVDAVSLRVDPADTGGLLPLPAAPSSTFRGQ